jgi:hypothetical protein
MCDVLLRGSCSYQKNRFGWVSRCFILVKGIRNFLTFLFLFLTLLGSSTNYYVSNSGNDSNFGTTPETAWKTIFKVKRSTFAPGDSILFKRGDVWDKDLVIPSSGTAGNPIVVGAYGEGDDPMFYGLKYQRNWESKGGNLYATYTPLYNGLSLVGGEQKIGEAKLTDLDENHEWWASGWDSIYVYLTNPSDTNNIRVNTQNFGVLIYGKNYVEIENFKFVGVSSALVARNSNNVIFRNCSADSSFYFGAAAFENSVNILIDSLTITNSFNYGIFFSNGADNVEVKNCKIINSGIATDRYGDNSSIGMWNTKGDISIHDCYIEQYDGEWCLELTAEVKEGWKSFNGRVDIYNNVIKYNGGDRTNDARFISAWSGDYYIYNNLFIGDKDKPITGVYTGEIGNIRTRTYIYNNTFVGLEIGVISYQNNFYDPTTSGEGAVVVKNNIFSEVSDSYIRVSGGTDEYGGMLAFTEVNNNLYFSHGSPTFKWGTKDFNFADWQTNSGQDANSVTGDPLFISNSDYSLQSGSPAIDAGTDLGLTHDINGNLIVDTPDIGAYEYGAKNSDTDKPTITGFTIPGTFDSLIVPVSTFTATDNISVTGFKITETATVPNANDAGWSTNAPSSYTFSTEGSKTLYAWVKDAAGNISTGSMDKVVITLPTTASNLANTIDYINGSSGTQCGTAAEKTVLTLSAPAGMVFSKVDFASYGNSSGPCPDFVLGSCHAATSQSVVEGFLLGNNSATINASNTIFGDPCSGTLKNLNILATYTAPICAGTDAGKITGSTPTGGTGTYTYLWESSTISSTTGFSAATGGINDTRDYMPGTLAQTTWFRRKVTSGILTDISKVVQITVTNCGPSPTALNLKAANITTEIDETDEPITKLKAYAFRNIEIRINGYVSGGSVATLYDISGRVIRSMILPEGSSSILPTPGIKPAIYILLVNDHGKIKTFKIPVNE